MVNISKIFGMVDCKPMTTSMELSLKKLCSSVVDPILGNASEYHQLLGASIFLVKSHMYICFAIDTLSQYMIETHDSH